jgi:hypothetical protein
LNNHFLCQLLIYGEMPADSLIVCIFVGKSVYHERMLR